ncbi:MAG: M10 family metallopeptidase, partial [Pararhodobacter sp.]
MCTICASVRPFEPDCAYEIINAIIMEGVDAPANTSTPYTIQVGDTFRGAINFNGDRDWVRIELQAGQSYDISLAASGAGRGTLPDAYLRVFNSSGTLVAQNDDGGIGFDSRLPSFTASYSGFFYLEAAAFGPTQTGTYELSVTGVGGGGGTVNPTLINNMANYLTHGYWAFNSAPARAFDTSSSNVISVDITSLTAEGRQLARWAMEAWEMVANVRFQEVSSNAQITFQDSESGAWASMQFTNPSVAGGVGRISSATINVSTNWLQTSGTTLDSYSFQTYVHEIGHALGLGHQGPYNNTADFGTQRAFDLDSWQLSIMSYYNQTQNPFTDASRAFIQTAMMSDLAAIQTLYGAPGANSPTAGATIWGANSNLGNYLVHSFNALLAGTTRAGVIGNDAVALTIYDVGGLDTIDLSTSQLGNRLDMTPGSFSDISGGRGNLAIHLNTWIEHAIGGSGNDTIQGNSANNLIHGGAGNDVIRSGGGRNVLYGGEGNDTIHAGGNDTVHGGSGVDTLVINPGLTVASVIFTRSVNNGDGTTTRDGVITFTNGQRLTFIDIENLPGGLPVASAGDANRSLTGTMGADVLIGGSGNDVLNALAGDDLIMATGGNNVIWGGRGDDTIWGANGNDTVGGGLGDDLIYGVAGNNMLWGSEGNDTVYGGTGNDTVGGGTGDDLIHGLSGRNELWGGRGNDTVYAG